MAFKEKNGTKILRTFNGKHIYAGSATTLETDFNQQSEQILICKDDIHQLNKSVSQNIRKSFNNGPEIGRFLVQSQTYF